MKITFIVCTTILMTLMSMTVNASEEKERLYLLQLLNQLNAIKPLIVSASKEQPKMNRIQFTYMPYHDIHGKTHNGLIDDINSVEQKIRSRLSKLSVEPHLIPAVKDDYISK